MLWQDAPEPAARDELTVSPDTAQAALRPQQLRKLQIEGVAQLWKVHASCRACHTWPLREHLVCQCDAEHAVKFPAKVAGVLMSEQLLRASAILVWGYSSKGQVIIWRLVSG